MSDVEDLSEQIKRLSRVESRAAKAEYTIDRLRRMLNERRTHKFWYVRIADVLEILDGKDLERF